MEILEDMNITELKLVNGEKLKIVFQDKHFFLQAKKMIFLSKEYHCKQFWIV